MNRFQITQKRVGLWIVVDTFDGQMMGWGAAYSDVSGLCKQLNRESIDERDAV